VSAANTLLVSPRGRDAERSDVERAAPTKDLETRSQLLPPLPFGHLPQSGDGQWSERDELLPVSPRGRDAERSDAERAAPPESPSATSSPLCPSGISPKGEKKARVSGVFTAGG
jgi:hypothetical protein